MKEISGQTIARLTLWSISLGMLLLLLAFVGITGSKTVQILLLTVGAGMCILSGTLWTKTNMSRRSQATGAGVSILLYALSESALSLNLFTEEIAIPVSTLSVLSGLVFILSLTSGGTSEPSP